MSNYCRCIQPQPAAGDFKIKLCTKCGYAIDVNLEDKISKLEKILELERKDKLQMQSQIDVLNSNMAKATLAIEKLTQIIQQNKADYDKGTRNMLTYLKSHQELWDEEVKKTLVAFCTCQQLAFAEVTTMHGPRGICVACFKEVDPQRIINEKAVDESCRTAKKENSTAAAATTTTTETEEMPEIIQPQNATEAEQMFMIRPGVYVKGGSCEGGSCDG
jgi:hypothetical protein